MANLRGVFRPRSFSQGASLTLPAPYAGLNLRDDIMSLQPNEARVLTNWIPAQGDLRLRSGYQSHGTGVGTGEVKTLATFNGLTTSKMIATGAGKFYDVSSAGAGSQIGTGFTNDRWNWVCYNNRLIFCNGADTPQTYDGSSLGSGGWSGSGLTATNLNNVALSRSRVWFTENNAADVWYAAAGAVTGAMTKFSLSQVTEGGTCRAIGHWSRDAGTTPDDYTLFVMSTGEVLIYSGDPASTFSLVGRFMVAPPIGQRCILNAGGEVILLTTMGMVPISVAKSGVALDFSAIDPWGKVQPGIVADAVAHSSNTGWSMHLHGGLLYIVVPEAVGTLARAWVLNTRTGGWSSIVGWNPSAMASFGGNLYFGGQTGGIVYSVTGGTDAGANITATANGAFTFPSGPQNTNLFTAIRPKMQSTGTVSGFIGVDTDYVLRPFAGSAVALSTDTSTAPWDSSAWDTTAWAEAGAVVALWQSITGSGRSVSVRLQAVGQSSDLRWFATDLLMKPGGIR